MNRLAVLALVLLLPLTKAQAIEYNELEVYGYQTTSPSELEIENSTSLSSDDSKDVDSRHLRSTFELNYGLSDRWEVTAYVDYERPTDEDFRYRAFRAHARTRFFEKGELPVDLGAYFEIELPKNSNQHDLSLEFKPIIEKDFSRWTVRLNPQIEFEHATDNGADPTVTKKTWHSVFGITAGVSYRYDEILIPHLDLFEGFTDQDALLMPSIDIWLVRHLKLTLGLGFGLNDKTEQRVANGRLEYEIYF